MKYRLDTKKPHIICLLLLISFPSVAAILISPALPVIAQYYGVDPGSAEQLITIFLVGYMLGQLIYSPFANRFGRKKATYIGIGIYLISCVICLFAIYIHSLEVLIIGRFLMALGSSVGMIITFTIINDFYHPEQSHTVTSYTVLSYAFMPALAIAIGGFITSAFSWIVCFYFCLIYGFIILIAVMQLPETLIEKEFGALKIRSISKNFNKAFKNWKLVVFSIISGLTGALIYVIASGGPFIGIKIIGLKPVIYGLFILIPYLGQFLGSLTSGWLSKKLPIYQTIALAYACIIIGVIFMLISFALQWINILTLLAPLTFIMFGIPMILSGSTVKALTNFDDKATGASAMSFIMMFIAFCFNFALTLLPAKNALMMPIIFAAIMVISIISFIHVRAKFKEN